MPSFPTQNMAPFSAWVFVLHFLLSAKPPPAEDWCARMIYGSDCQGLLKPIQFQDSGSHFLSFMAHLMNSHYQLTCFIIVKTLIEVVFKKNMWKRKNIKRLHHIFFFFTPDYFAWSSQPRHLATQQLADLTNWSPHSPLTVLCLHLLGLVFCLFGPFLAQMVKAVESSPLEKGPKLSLQQSVKVHLSWACVDSIRLFPLSSTWCGLFSFLFSFHKPKFFGWNAGFPGPWLLLQPAPVLWRSHG